MIFFLCHFIAPTASAYSWSPIQVGTTWHKPLIYDNEWVFALALIKICITIYTCLLFLAFAPVKCQP
jgi:hypothetical protein